MSVVLAIDIGGTKYALALVDSDGKILDSVKNSTQREAGAAWMVGEIIAKGHQLIDRFPGQVRAAGVGFGGPVDYQRQTILASLHVPGWFNYPLTDAIRDKLHLPCVMDNDANTGALGEARYGAGREFRSLIYYTVSTGVGGGFIVDGELWRGAHSQAAELGHIPIVWDGPECSCGGRGCLEALCSGLAIAKRAEQRARHRPDSALHRLFARQERLTAKDVFDKARAGDRLAQELVGEVQAYLATGIAAAVNVLDPEAVVIGGGISLAGDVLFRGLAERINASLVIPGRRCLPVLPAKLQENSVLLGAAALALELISPGGGKV